MADIASLGRVQQPGVANLSKWVSTLHSSLPLDATLRRNCIDRMYRQLLDLVVLLEKRVSSIKLAATAFGKLNAALQAFQPAIQQNEATSLLEMNNLQ